MRSSSEGVDVASVSQPLGAVGGRSKACARDAPLLGELGASSCGHVGVLDYSNELRCKHCKVPPEGIDRPFSAGKSPSGKPTLDETMLLFRSATSTPMQKFFRITLPLLSPVIFFVAVILTLFNVQVFDQVFIFVESAAGSLLREASRTAVYSIYEEAFVDFTLGRAAAQSVILLLIVILLTWVQFWIQRKWVYYE